MIEKISLNALKFFYYVAEYGSVTLASQKLFVTQSAVSKQIKNLEDTLDLSLFNRVNKKLSIIEKVKKFTNVKLYGEKPSVVIAPSKKGAKNTTKNLLFSNVVKLNLKSFFQFYPFYKSLCY